MTDHRRRPRAMTAEAVSTILAHISVGKSIPQAAVKADVHRQTVQRWIADGNAERTRLEMAGVDTTEIDDDDPRISSNVRLQFAFARAVDEATQLPGAEIIATLYQAATEGLTEITTVETAERNENGEMIVTGRRTTETTKVDLTSARWLAERLDDRMNLPARVELTGAGGEAIQIAGFSERQADAFAVFVRTMISELVKLVPARSRPKLEKAIPDVLDVAMAAIGPPKTEEPTDVP